MVSTYGTSQCATNTVHHPVAGCSVLAPEDAVGNPLYTGYAPAFGQSVFNIAAYGYSPTPAPFTLDTSGDGKYPLIESAMLTLPIWPSPYDPTTAAANNPTISVLLPYLPAGAGVGFPVTIDGSRDKFYNTSQLALSGETFDGVLDFEPVPFPAADGGVQDSNVVRAIESQNYLGLAFACVQTNTDQTSPLYGQPDVLAVRMYENENDLLAYLAKYPGAAAACQIQVKYSIFGNYADYISSLQYGARFGLNAGFGGSVVVDLTLFDPNVVATLGQ
jgi:hypothetical protein